MAAEKPTPPFDTFVFDVDGTLLDTLDDLVVLTNDALAEFNLPPRTREEINSYVAVSYTHLALLCPDTKRCSAVRPGGFRKAADGQAVRSFPAPGRAWPWSSLLSALRTERLSLIHISSGT